MSIFKSSGDSIYIDTPYCEFYIPLYYYDSSKRFAKDLGSQIEVFGVFNVGIFEGGKLKQMKTMNLPTLITMDVYETEQRNITLINGEDIQCKVLKYIKGQRLMSSIIFESFASGKEYLRLLMTGNLPPIIPYSQQKQVWIKNQQINHINFGVSDTYLETILRSILRAKSDLSLSYAKVSDTAGEYDYASASIRQICQYNSTFTALVYEDIDSMITSSLNKSREKVKEKYTPVEQIIKF